MNVRGFFAELKSSVAVSCRHYGLAAILVFVGAKMLLADLYKVPTVIALGVVAGILIVAVIASLLRPPPRIPSRLE